MRVGWTDFPVNGQVPEKQFNLPHTWITNQNRIVLGSPTQDLNRTPNLIIYHWFANKKGERMSDDIVHEISPAKPNINNFYAPLPITGSSLPFFACSVKSMPYLRSASYMFSADREMTPPFFSRNVLTVFIISWYFTPCLATASLVNCESSLMRANKRPSEETNES